MTSAIGHVDDESRIRDIEREVLDCHHRQFALLQRSQVLAVGHIFKTVGDFLRDVGQMPRNGPLFEMHGQVQAVLFGLSRSLRWILSEAPAMGSGLQPLNQLNREAEELLIWGAKYSQIAEPHVAWSRGLASASVDESRHHIRFKMGAGCDMRFLFSQFEAEESLRHLTINKMPWDALLEIRRWAAPQLRLTEAGLAGLPTEVVRHHRFPEILSWVDQALFAELDSSDDLGEYTVAQARRFYAGVWVYSRIVVGLEDDFDRQLGHTHCLGSLPFVLKRDQAVSTISQWTAFDSFICDRIMADLTFDPKPFHVDVMSQPFVVTASGEFVCLPRLLADLLPGGMFARAIARGRKPRVYDRVKQKIHDAVVHDVATAFSQGTLCVRQTRCIESAEHITPDLMIWSAQSENLLVMDIKHFLAAHGAAKVGNRASELKKGLSQVQRYVRLCYDGLARVRTELSLPEKVCHVIGVIILRWPLPLPIEESSFGGVMVAAWPRVLALVEKQPILSLEQLRKCILDASLPTMNMADIEEIDISMNCGDWTYSHNVLSRRVQESSRFV